MLEEPCVSGPMLQFSTNPFRSSRLKALDEVHLDSDGYETFSAQPHNTFCTIPLQSSRWTTHQCTKAWFLQKETGASSRHFRRNMRPMKPPWPLPTRRKWPHGCYQRVCFCSRLLDSSTILQPPLGPQLRRKRRRNIFCRHARDEGFPENTKRTAQPWPS